MNHFPSILFLLILSLSACGPNKNTPEYVARKYLEALKEKNWEEAKKYTDKQTAQNLDMMRSLGTDFGLTDVKDIKCKIYHKDEAVCNFCCSSDSEFYCLDIRRAEDRKWFVFFPKDGGCRGPDEIDTTNSDTL